MKSLLDEYDTRERNCQRRWNLVLKENLQLSQANQETQQQLKRQRDQLQHVIAVTERNLAEANLKVAHCQDEVDKQKAAEFLVAQVRQL